MRPPHAPLYDASFEHDACGVGFVADAGGKDRGRVLELALAGLASLRHRGAFAADGASSDGAGVALPLERELRARLEVPDGAGVVVAFLPAGARASTAARELVDACLAREGLAVERWRPVPIDRSALGSQALESAPIIDQAIVQRPAARNARSFERSLIVARRRMEQAAREADLADFSIPSASARSVVYKGLVAGDRLADFYLDLTAVPVSYTVFHQRYATNTHPRWALAQPFRFIAHNGEINTVRSNREQLRGRARSLGGRDVARLLDAGPLLNPDASDSLSLDEAIEILSFEGRTVGGALLTAIPEALPLRTTPHAEVAAFQERIAGAIAPWDGPAAIVFSDGMRVGALMDRNGLRPAAFTVTHRGLVALASEAGAVPISAAETRERGRLGPGEMLLVEPRARGVWHDADAKRRILATRARHDGGTIVGDAHERASRTVGDARDRSSRTSTIRPFSFADTGFSSGVAKTDQRKRWIAGLDAERLRLSIRTMTLEGQEPLWSMGDDTPTPALSALDRPVVDHLRQSFAQVTNPAIDPERERIVMDLAVELGRRPPLLDRTSHAKRSARLSGPIVADMPAFTRTYARRRGERRLRVLDATWTAESGPEGLEEALARLATEAVEASSKGVELCVLSDRAFRDARLPVPSVLAVGAVHTALTERGMRGATDLLVESADILDVHAAAMALASGATAVHPWLALELAAELAGGRGAEELAPEDACRNLVLALEKGLRKVLARMGISCIASYVGGQFFETLELHASLTERCFPAAPRWSGSVDARAIAARQLRRLESAATLGGDERLPDPGFARYRGDGERHLFAPTIVKAVQALATESAADPLSAYREAVARPEATVRDQLAIRIAPEPLPLDDVESPSTIAHRFVGAAMSLGALSPEAHQAITLGLRQIGAASNTGEGGEDPAWYGDEPDGRTEHRPRARDSAIKQVASARFGVTAEYLARAEQLEIKIAQGSKPGEGGQLPGRKATELIARLRRGQPGQSMISPPPHHDIYSIEDLAQLIADLRAINPGARIGVKLVASLGIGTIAAGVAKAGADYVQISGHAGGTGASPLSSIKHVGAPWELGLAEVHQVLIRNALRDRVSLRTDGGLQTGRDVLIAALLGAEEFGFGTAALIAIGCDMARQCHLDTCPTGIATQRDDLRAKFSGSPDDVARFFVATAHDVQRELAAAGLRSIGEAVGRTDLLEMRDASAATIDLSALLAAPDWTASRERRAHASSSRAVVTREPASIVENRLAAELLRLPSVSMEDGTHIERPDERIPETDDHEPTAQVTTADRSLGAHVSGLIERGLVRRPVSWLLRGSAGQSFGAFAGPSVRLVLQGQANDYVGKGLSGGTLVLRPEDELLDDASSHAIAGNTCLYGATAGRLHVVGRAGMRFAVRNSGAQAVVEGIGPHGCEYMTGGAVVVLGSVGRNFCAGMTGGRVYLYDPAAESVGAVDRASVEAIRLGAAVAAREDGHALLSELHDLLRDHADAGSTLARAIVRDSASLADSVWLIEARAAAAVAAPSSRSEIAGR